MGQYFPIKITARIASAHEGGMTIRETRGTQQNTEIHQNPISPQRTCLASSIAITAAEIGLSIAFSHSIKQPPFPSKHAYRQFDLDQPCSMGATWPPWGALAHLKGATA